MARTVVLAVDIGTTAVKVVALEAGSAGRRLHEREYPLLLGPDGRQVQRPEDVLGATTAALSSCVREVGAGRVAGLVLCTAMHGLVGLRADGTPATPVLTWADSRSAEDAAALRGTDLGHRLHRETGTPVHPMSPLVKLLWLRRVHRSTWEDVARWADLKALLVQHLTGVVATELSSASASGLLDRHTMTWSSRALELAEIEEPRLPRLLEPSDALPLGPAAAAGIGLPSGTPVVLGAADGPLGNLGTGAVRPDVPGLSLGTSGAVRLLLPEQPVDLDPGLFSYVLTRDRAVVGSAVSNGGVVMRWAGELLTPGVDDDEAIMALAAQAPAGADGLVVLPYLLAERAPWWDPDVPGAVLGLRRRHGRAHLVRAAVEGVARQLASVTRRLAALHDLTAVRGTGGTLRSPLWRQVLADHLELPLEVVDAAEGTAVGAGAMGLVALGLARDVDEAVAGLTAGPDGVVVREVTEPSPDGVRAARSATARVADLLDALEPARDLSAREASVRKST